MTQPLFRPEAVEHHARARLGGRTLELRDTLAARGFIALLVGLVLVAVVGSTVSIDESASGTAVVPLGESEAVLLLPIGAQPRLRVGLTVQLRLSGAGVVTTRIVAVDQPLGWELARRLAGSNVPGAPGTPVAVARASLPPGPRLGARRSGTAVVVLARRSLLGTLLPTLVGS